jgi:hypothetical protein
LRLTTLVRLAVQFNSPVVPQALSEVEPDPIQEALRSVVANPEQIQMEKTGDRPAPLKGYLARKPGCRLLPSRYASMGLPASPTRIWWERGSPWQG